MITRAFASVLAGALAAGNAQAALYDRGGGLIYDDVLNVTWLQDANYARTSGYDDDGWMTWSEAKTWAQNLVFGGFDDWRLPRTVAVDGAWNNDISFDGSTDQGYNFKDSPSEHAFNFYSNLGGVAYFDTTGERQANYGIVSAIPFQNVHSISIYWSETPVDPIVSGVWSFSYGSGYQAHLNPTGAAAAWAVRDGDVAAVPEPETYVMMLAGVGLVGAITRRRRCVTYTAMRV